MRTAAFDVPAEGMSAFAQEMDDLQVSNWLSPEMLHIAPAQIARLSHVSPMHLPCISHASPR